ncbi:hypothetical protein IscW_ISCW014135 [Ixodes scapularis]|uniref:Uncharacterized protein n=1 Tax=Ixodes scapularis TaxID=6945 RepID=B7QHE8_IXOSC|nr:hypothetical protein IscW_ISCW014135 [Ixodes scapularis]|eukprot:XP_002414605.1 hypothetical protein IscW_ISCW014135 [Ixodes scapularis]
MPSRDVVAAERGRFARAQSCTCASAPAQSSAVEPKERSHAHTTDSVHTTGDITDTVRALCTIFDIFPPLPKPCGCVGVCCAVAIGFLEPRRTFSALTPRFGQRPQA